MSYSCWEKDNKKYDEILSYLEKEFEEINDTKVPKEDEIDFDLPKKIDRFKPTELRISTITAVSNINTKYVNLNEITKHICSECGLFLENDTDYHKCIKSKKKKIFIIKEQC